MAYISDTQTVGTCKTTRPAANASLLKRIATLFALARTRHQLKSLDAHMLDDIGLTRSQALTEAKRPLWDAPATWKQ